ncbi:OmpA family protein [Roseomonas gilardii]|uniref:OmpA family protein n=2 Tax=Roseomonas TaxID=125216 RepID=A0ABU3MLP2_9PROT|nr:OmpA family protein [Roseomonas gilardii]MDT8333605.1 OmpA family protein [Roseomonas gilardii]
MAFWRRLLCSTLFLAPAAALAQPVTGLYLGGAAGLNFRDPNSGKVGGAVGRTLAESGLSREIRTDFNLGWAGLGSVGWGFGNGLRLEIEGNYRSNDLDRYTIAGYRLPRAKGSAETYGVMANAYYDFDLSSYGISSSALMPYIGVGVGYAWSSHRGLSGSINATAPAGLADRVVSRVNSELESRFLANLTAEQRAELPANAIPQINLNTSNLNANAQVRSDDTDGDFAYQAMAGVAFPIRAVPGLAVTAEYRFFGTLSNKLSTSVTASAAGYSIDRTYDIKYDNFNHSAMLGLRYALWTPPAPVAAVAPTPAPAQTAARTYLVFFDWDRYNLTDRARQIIAEAAQNARSTGSTRIEVAGHADRSGTPQYNMGLSRRRADAVAAELVRQGIQRSEITVEAFGESRPLVPTADGVREPQNRRVEIVLR